MTPTECGILVCFLAIDGRRRSVRLAVNVLAMANAHNQNPYGFILDAAD